MFDTQELQPWQDQLAHHPVYAAVQNLDELRIFMAHHIYPVWDFMSLVKYLQHCIAPARVPWLPEHGNAGVRRFINELVQEEESDESLSTADGQKIFASHFMMYCAAMEEIGANTAPIQNFIDQVAKNGIHTALAHPGVLSPARDFMQTTFTIIDADQPHCVAAALALGREHVIPCMFRALLQRMGIGADQAPIFHYYLERHIHLDSGSHGPLSMQMLTELCGNDPLKQEQARRAAQQALDARIAFWDGVYQALQGGVQL